MLLFEHKQHLQSCDTQSSKQRKDILFYSHDFTSFLPG